MGLRRSRPDPWGARGALLLLLGEIDGRRRGLARLGTEGRDAEVRRRLVCDAYGHAVEGTAVPRLRGRCARCDAWVRGDTKGRVVVGP